jgi:hypothetical protein
MILKLVDNKVLVETMFVPELVEHTYLQYIREPNTQHLHPVLYFNNQTFYGDKVFIKVPTVEGNLEIKVDLLDDNKRIVRTYTSNMPYNIYQVLGHKPIRPDIEDYLYKLEEEIRVLKQTLIDEQTRFNTLIKDLEEKGDIV